MLDGRVEGRLSGNLCSRLAVAAAYAPTSVSVSAAAEAEPDDVVGGARQHYLLPPLSRLRRLLLHSRRPNLLKQLPALPRAAPLREARLKVLPGPGPVP